MTRSGTLEHLGRRVKRILARGKPTPFHAVRTGGRLLNASHLHCIVEEPTVAGATGALSRLGYGRRAGTVERSGFSANLRVGIEVLSLLRLSVSLLRVALLGVRGSWL